MSKASQGLAQIIAGDTSLCEITQDTLRYRGYAIGDLADHCQFEEVAYLLLYGELPGPRQLEGFGTRVIAAMTVPAEIARVLDEIPHDVAPMDVLRSAVSLLSHLDPDRDDNAAPANLRKSERLLGQIAAVIGYRNRQVQSLGELPVDPAASFAANLLRLLKGTAPTEAETRIMNVSLILYAEHEYNASTFTARVIVATLADLHAGIVGAIGALKGPLHGGANEAAMHMLMEIGSPEAAEPFVRERMASKGKLMGFGHRVYKHGDHRARILEAAPANSANRLARPTGRRSPKPSPTF